jgi:hypothetical protein
MMDILAITIGEGLAITREVPAAVKNTGKTRYNGRSQNFKL